MTSQVVQMGPKGRVVIPASYRDALGLQPGDDLVVILDGQELRLISRREVLRRIQEEMTAAVPAARVLSEELLAERRAEAARE
ncbi:MAG: AbrB/MazE/SpoVT family DNA-binding domain-containing protein [Chloroflexota bacterium]